MCSSDLHSHGFEVIALASEKVARLVKLVFHEGNQNQLDGAVTLSEPDGPKYAPPIQKLDVSSLDETFAKSISSCEPLSPE